MTKTKIFGSTKTYTHSVGLSCAFRQWRAKSHCRFIHGYAIAVTLDFQTYMSGLDENGWVVDFGGLKDIKKWLEDTFDHKLLVASSDPKRDSLVAFARHGIAQINVLPEVGCEAFARIIADRVQNWLVDNMPLDRGIWLRRVTVREHEGNSAYVDFGDTE